jgi:hypothetical protein
MKLFIKIVFRYLRAKVRGERFYIVLLEPDRQWLIDDVRDMSGDLIWDGFSQSMRVLINDGVIRQQMSDEEIAQIKQQEADMKVQAMKEAADDER